MIEIFSGTATLCSVAKQYGMLNSLALDKIKKRGSKTTIFVFDITKSENRELLFHWLESPLVSWVHMAPVCGTCSRAREIDNGGPPPLRSDAFPMGLPTLGPEEQRRVAKANKLYFYACEIFLVPQPWHTGDHGKPIVVDILANYAFPPSSQGSQIELHKFSDVHAGWIRPKWTQLAANFGGISELDQKCDNSHKRLPWGKVLDDTGRLIFATSEEAQYPRKMCVALGGMYTQAIAEARFAAVTPRALCSERSTILHLGGIQNFSRNTTKKIQIATIGA